MPPDNWIMSILNFFKEHSSWSRVGTAMDQRKHIPSLLSGNVDGSFAIYRILRLKSPDAYMTCFLFYNTILLELSLSQ